MSRFGFVAVVGRPNVGKSALVNALLEEELCSVASMPQTTRQCIRGILTTAEGQAVFVDTPGMQDEKYLINQALAESARKQIRSDETDAVMYVVDLSRSHGKEEGMVAGMLKGSRKPTLVVFNKSDLVANPGEAAGRFMEAYPFLAEAPQVTISAIGLTDRQSMVDRVLAMLPDGEPHFPKDYYTDANMRLLAEEMIRYQVIHNVRDEVPHATCVQIDQWDELDEEVSIHASLIVETQGQKAIVLGPEGKRIKQIRQFSRKRIAAMTQTKVKLDLFVKVRPKWRNNPAFLRRMGMNLPKPKRRKQGGPAHG